MDAVEFFKAKDRMCKMYWGNCKICDLSSDNNAMNIGCSSFVEKYPEKAVAIVEKWAKKHPLKTRQSEFLKLFPDARLFDGVLAIDPCKINSSRFDSKECRSYSDEFGVLSCEKCREQFWNEEVE